MKKIELLAPAGNLEKMKTAFLYGADAVYLGVPDFSLRVRINDFNLKTLEEGIKTAHRLKKKVYVTINIFAHNQHIKKLPSYLKLLNRLRPDALIISDPGVLSLVKKHCPKISIHLSTQANCTNLEAVKFWARQGVSRIILGREVTLKEIREIKKALPKMELEYFVHGAMCMAYSGRCFLSQELVSRSANLGDCAQPCRWSYEVSIKPEGHDKSFELVNEKHGSYLLNSLDLCLIKHLPELIKAGITSLKIEGRAKSVYYLATVVGAYSFALKKIEKKASAVKMKKDLDYLYKELEEKLSHRGYTTGFLLNEKAGQNIKSAKEESDWEFCGQTLAWLDGLALLKVHNTLTIDSPLEIICPEYDIIKIRPKEMFDASSARPIKKAHGGSGQLVVVSSPAISVGSVWRRKR